MHIDERIDAFCYLGEKILSIDDESLNDLVTRAMNENAWFTATSIQLALTGVRKLLDRKSLEQWISSYNFSQNIKKTIALTLAGNIPLVGFHDILCVLISGNAVQIKPSSKDSILTTFLLDQLIELEPRFKSSITLTDKLKNFDAVIATGSDNSSRYFDFYFRKYPSIIRKNRTSCAILKGDENATDIENLGTDVFSYFGLGCRNVSKLFLPKDYSISNLLDSWQKFEHVIHHHKYANNYDYQKAIMMINKASYYDNGFVLLTPSDKMVSPISVLYYDSYQSHSELEEKINQSSDKIQCIVGNQFPATVPFGQAQYPGPEDYADQVDTLKFLIDLAKV